MKHTPTNRLSLVPWAAAAACVVAALGALVPIRSWDVWFHVALGGVIDHFGAVPDLNHFSYAHPADAPAFDLPWLAQRVLHAIHASFGPEGLAAARNLIGGFAVGVVSWAAGRRVGSGKAGLLAGLVGASVVGHFVDVSPALLALGLLATVLAVTAEARASASERAPLVAGAVFVAAGALWVNLDHAFMLPALVALLVGVDTMLSEDDASTSRGLRWLAVAGAAAAAPLLNPRGYLVYQHLIEVLTLYPTHPDAPTWAPLLPWSGLEGVGIWGLLAVCVAVRWRGPREDRVLDVGALVAFGLLAITHQRAAAWFGLSLPFWMAPALRGLIPADAGEPSRLKVGLVTAALLVAPLLVQPVVVTHRPLALALSPFDVRRVQPHAGVILADVPVTSAQMIRNSVGAPRVYAPPRLSGYLLHTLVSPEAPRQTVFSDPRVELVDQTRLEVREMIETTDMWRGLFQGYDVSVALLDETTQGALVEALDEHLEWQRVHVEGDLVTFVRVTRAGG